MNLRILGIMGVVFGMLLASCSGNSSSPSLDGTSWILTELNGKPTLTEPFVTLGFDQGNLGGTDGCNHYGGPYSVKGDQFTPGKEIMSTLMACEDSIMQRASEYMTALTRSVRYQLTGGELKLLDENGTVVAVFKIQSQDLSGTSWSVTGYNNGNQGVTSPILETNLTLKFSSDGKISGTAGCNGFFGTYKAGKGTLTFSDLGRTEMFCTAPEGIMTQEDQYLAALRSAVAYRIDGNTLILRTADDQTAVTLVKMP